MTDGAFGVADEHVVTEYDGVGEDDDEDEDEEEDDDEIEVGLTDGMMVNETLDVVRLCV